LTKIQIITFLLLISPFFSAATEKQNILPCLAKPLKTLPVSDSCSIAAKEKTTIKIPLKRVGNLFFIEAEVDNIIGNFVLDLGAPYLVLNSTYFRDYEVDENYYAGTLVSGTDYVRRTQVEELNISGLIQKNLSADVTDLGEIENSKGLKILGLLGVAIFKDYVFDLDVLKQQLFLHPRLDTEKIKEELFLEAPIRMRNNLLTLKSKLNNIKLELSLDTAAETNILDSKLPSRVFEGMKILKTAQIRDGNGATTETVLSLMKGITIEKIALKKMPTLILNLETMSRAYDKKIDGMLGFPFFASGRIIIDFRKKRLFIYEFK